MAEPTDTSLFALAFSPCGSVLVAAGSFGSLHFWRVGESGAEPEEHEQEHEHELWIDTRRKAFAAVHSGHVCVYSLQTSGDLLVVGGAAGITVWSWASLLSGAPASCAPVWTVPTHAVGLCEINSVSVQHGGLLFAAGGSGLTYVYDLGAQQETAVLRGHTQYVHSVAAYPVTLGMAATASEDNTVRIFDVRVPQRAAAVFSAPAPASASAPAPAPAPARRGWVAAVDVNASENFLVCGGGSPLSLWHLRGGTCAGTLIEAGLAQLPHTQFVRFDRSEILALSNNAWVTFWGFDKAMRHKSPSSLTSLFCAARNKPVHAADEVLAVCGNGPVIDLFMPSDTRSSTTLVL